MRLFFKLLKGGDEVILSARKEDGIMFNLLSFTNDGYIKRTGSVPRSLGLSLNYNGKIMVKNSGGSHPYEKNFNRGVETLSLRKSGERIIVSSRSSRGSLYDLIGIERGGLYLFSGIRNEATSFNVTLGTDKLIVK